MEAACLSCFRPVGKWAGEARPGQSLWSPLGDSEGRVGALSQVLGNRNCLWPGPTLPPPCSEGQPARESEILFLWEVLQVTLTLTLSVLTALSLTPPLPPASPPSQLLVPVFGVWHCDT